MSIFYNLDSVNGVIKQHNHLYLLVLCPNAGPDDTQFEYRHLSQRPYFYRYALMRWATEVGIIELPVRWTFWNDTIAVGNQTFDRNAGNVFVAVRQPTGEWDSRQCGNLGAHATYDEALQLILNSCREHLPVNLGL